MWYPLRKSAEEVDRGERKRVLYSIISAEVPDAVNDVVRQDGMDCGPLVEAGYANWDHMDGPAHLIGEPLSTDRTEIDAPGLGRVPATEGRIWLYTGHPEADAVWSLCKAQRAPHARRRLGTSVQGEIRERQGHDIVKSLIRHIAVSHQPLMPLSFVAIEKSLRAQMARSMAAAPDSPTNTLNLDTGGWIYGPCKGGRTCYRRDLSFRGGARGALRHLVRCRGMDPDVARSLLVGLHRSLRAV